MQFINSPAIYIPDTPNFLLLGIPFGSGQEIILSLEMMRKFKYICIDDETEEVSISGNELFSAAKEEGWRSYPMAVEPNGNNLFMYISIPVQGQVLKLWFDTGSRNGLVFSKEQWDKVVSLFPYFNIYSGHITLPLIGQIKCRRGWPRNVNIAGTQLSDPTVEVIEEDKKIFNEGDSFIGMECFKKKTIVLNFTRNLFWIK